MTLRRYCFWVLALTFISSSILVWASQPKYKFYEKLIDEASDIIADADKILPLIMKKKKFDDTFDAVIKSGLIKVIILSEFSFPIEIRYYYNKDLIAVDNLDERRKILRRDIFDKNGSIRVQKFYGEERRVIRIDYINKKGGRIKSEMFRLPYLGPWRYY